MNSEIDNIREKAIQNFKSGYNCAQAVVITFADKLNISPDTLAKLAQPFGGGMCRMREICGAVSGMMICYGLVNGSSDNNDKATKDDVYTKGQELCNEFISKNGSIICKELLNLTKKENSPISSERTSEYYKKRPCAEIVGEAATIVAKNIFNCLN